MFAAVISDMKSCLRMRLIVEQPRRRFAVQAQRRFEQEPGLEDVAAKALASPGNEMIALAQQRQRAIQLAVPGDRRHVRAPCE
jgi:hypothetical protein